jgi:hypothetical protein
VSSHRRLLEDSRPKGSSKPILKVATLATAILTPFSWTGLNPNSRAGSRPWEGMYTSSRRSIHILALLYLYGLAVQCRSPPSDFQSTFVISIPSFLHTCGKLRQFLLECLRMSANHGKPDSSYRAEYFSSVSPRSRPYSPGMELTSSRYQSPQQLNIPLAESSAMSTLALRRPSPILPSPSDMMWEDRRQLELPSRPRSPPERVELPSIRQVSPNSYCRLSKSNTFRRLFQRFS